MKAWKTPTPELADKRCQSPALSLRSRTPLGEVFTFIDVRWQPPHKDLAGIAFHALPVLVGEAVRRSQPAVQGLIPTPIIQEAVFHREQRGLTWRGGWKKRKTGKKKTILTEQSTHCWNNWGKCSSCCISRTGSDLPSEWAVMFSISLHPFRFQYHPAAQMHYCRGKVPPHNKPGFLTGAWADCLPSYFVFPVRFLLKSIKREGNSQFCFWGFHNVKLYIPFPSEQLLTGNRYNFKVKMGKPVFYQLNKLHI